MMALMEQYGHDVSYYENIEGGARRFSQQSAGGFHASDRIFVFERSIVSEVCPLLRVISFVNANGNGWIH